MIGIIDSYKVTLVLRKNFLSSDPPDGGVLREVHVSERFMSSFRCRWMFGVVGVGGGGGGGH